MKLTLLIACALLALLVSPSASATPPVCLEKGASALGTTVEVRITCGPGVSITRCPPVGDGPCDYFSTDSILA